MYKHDKSGDEQNFWISYADLMAGLLFVFILLVGAIVVRYVYVQEDLDKKRTALGESETLLSRQSEKIRLFKAQIAEAAQNLTQEERKRLALESSISLKGQEISKLKELLLDDESKIGRLESLVHTMEENVTTLEKSVDKHENILRLKDEELAVLGAKLLEQSKAHQMLVQELNITKVRIKSLTGIRIKVVDKLREKLGDSIMIDAHSGAIRFSSNILFAKDEYRLKQKAKLQIREIIQKYIHTLLDDEKIKPFIEGIMIEGHTDTDGTYLHNLALSQKRALEVMKFLYDSDPANSELYSHYLSASGKSYADLIYKDGKEDKEASRRIEIKFRIKNEQAIKELENFLNREKKDAI